MPHRYRRTDRVEELLRQEIARLIREEVKDPRVGFATIMHVDVSPDLSHARVLVSVMGDEREKAATVDALRRASGFLRARVGDDVSLKRMPELHFELDRSLERAARIDEIIDRTREEEGGGEPPPGGA